MHVRVSNNARAQARNNGLNLSRVTEQALDSILDYLATQNYTKNTETTHSKEEWWAGPDLNQRPLARKANVLPN